MDDDLMPNDGTFLGGVPREPLDQILGRKREKAQTLEGLNELKGIVNRLQEQIEFYERNSSIPDDVRTKPKQFLVMHNSFSEVAKILRGEKEYIEDLISSYIKDR